MGLIVLLSTPILCLVPVNMVSNSSVQLQSNEVNRIVLEFVINDHILVPIETPQGMACAVHLDHGVSILDKGAPDMHQLVQSVIIPDDGMMSVEVISVAYDEYTNIEVAPSKGNLSRQINPKDILFIYSEVYQEDQFYPGDLAKELPTGHIQLIGRSDDVIIRGGVNIYPNEIESIMTEDPGINEVAIIGHKDSERGEVIIAFIETNQNFELSKTKIFCKENLAPYKIP